MDKLTNPDSTWSFNRPAMPDTSTTATPDGNMSNVVGTTTTAQPTEFYSTETTNRRRNLLQVDEVNPACNIDPDDYTDFINFTYVNYFPPKCQEYSCKIWSRDTTYLNFTEGMPDIA